MWRADAHGPGGPRRVTIAIGGEADDYVVDQEELALHGVAPAVREGHVFLTVQDGGEIVIKLTAEQAHEIGTQLLKTSTELRAQRAMTDSN